MWVRVCTATMDFLDWVDLFGCRLRAVLEEMGFGILLAWVDLWAEGKRAVLGKMGFGLLIFADVEDVTEKPRVEN